MNDEPLLVIIGPSGVGKSSVVKLLQEKQLIQLVPSWTTRTPRLHERDGAVDHVFVSEEEFENQAQAGFFVEDASLFGLPYRYGLPHIPHAASRNGKVPTVMLRASLLPLLSRHYSNYTTYQIQDTLERVTSRLNDRMKVGEPQGERLKEYAQEIAIGRQIADRVFLNDTTIENITEQFTAAIKTDFILESRQ
jgi:guanylate kinase